MSLKTRITEDMKDAMRARNAARLSTIRLLLAAIKQKEVDERLDASDADIVAIIERTIKQRRESIGHFEAGKRADLAANERAEIELLQTYLPQALPDAQVDALITAAIAGAGGGGMAAMGKVMAALKPQLAGRADMGTVSAKVKARLAG
ncbi:MAG: GatB/YqeY domain-containing protein [Casimicrobiaceae bacterium]